MNATGSRNLPPTPSEAPSFADVNLNLDELFYRGTEEYRRDVPRREYLFEELKLRLAQQDHKLLTEYRDYLQEVMRMWGEDRFRIGYAVGASLDRWFDGPWLAH